ncbi:MAG: 3-hydroxyacyl-ACP dehydratase FabZ [Dehalococcoidia bacterium]|nr:3-hydroxyacyl-ACP dehydratase FabZ [Dehalococcoidia bacterium]
MLENKEIQAIIGVRFPFLFVDKVLELAPGTRAVAIKNFTANEWFFQGHLPGHPLVPGVLIIETLAQSALLTLFSVPENKGKGAAFSGVDKFQFRRPVLPGDTLRMEVQFVRSQGVFQTFSATASVEGKVAASGQLTMAVTEKGVPITP